MTRRDGRRALRTLLPQVASGAVLAVLAVAWVTASWAWIAAALVLGAGCALAALIETRIARRGDGPQIPLDDDHRPPPLWRRVLAALLGVRIR